MIIFPAIDIIGGKVVRLKQGKFDQVKEYSGDPVSMAKRWQDHGAQWLHVVDLDAAQTSGETHNHVLIKEIAKALEIPVQLGGGIRSQEMIHVLLDSKISRIVLGTKVIEDRSFLEKALSVGNEKIAVSLDCEEGYLMQKAWTVKSEIKAVDLAKEMQSFGLKCIIYTDISRDGMLTGPNYDGIKELLSTTEIPIIASGGVSTLMDLNELMRLNHTKLEGAIIGKALYEGTIDLKEAIALCSQKG